MQLLFEKSEEFGNTRGLNLLNGTVKKLKKKVKTIPHMNWNKIYFGNLDNKSIIKTFNKKRFLFCSFILL